MTASLHLFMRDLLVRTTTTADDSSLVVDNARMHHVQPKQIAGTKKASQHKRLRSKDYELDVSDHTKKDSRWTSHKEQQQQQQQQQRGRGFNNSLDVSDHSKKESRWSCTSDNEAQGAQQEMISPPTSPSSPPSTWSLMKSLDVSDHSKRESRWDSLSSVPLYHPHHDDDDSGADEPEEQREEPHHHRSRCSSSSSSQSLSPIKKTNGQQERNLTQWKDELRRNSYDTGSLLHAMEETSLLLEQHRTLKKSRSSSSPQAVIVRGNEEQQPSSSSLPKETKKNQDAIKHLLQALDIVQKGRQITV